MLIADHLSRARPIPTNDWRNISLVEQDIKLIDMTENLAMSKQKKKEFREASMITHNFIVLKIIFQMVGRMKNKMSLIWHENIIHLEKKLTFPVAFSSMAPI